MAKDHSFDIVCDVDMQEIDNTINQTIKEISTRFDFKGSKSKISLEGGNIIKIISDDDFRLRSVIDIMQSKAIKRGISLKTFDYGKIESAAGDTVRQMVNLRKGISKDDAKIIIKHIKELKLKVTAQIQDDQVRVCAKDIDDLQAVIRMLKERDYAFPIQFINYR